MKIVNPATEEVIGDVGEDNSESLEKKFRKIEAGQRKWQQVPLPERVNILKRFAAELSEQIEHCATVLTSEVGKPLQQSRNEVKGACARIAWLTGNAEKYLSDEVMQEGNGMKEIIRYEPLGVICNISAWNYPYLVGVNVFVPALLAGNAVMYKPSEFSTLTGMLIEMYLKKAGVLDYAFEIAIGGKEVGEQLLHMSFDGYFFTGSYKTGRHIYESVAHKMVPCQLELGGKDPVYVADDVADVAAAAAGIADGAFYNNGQSCCSVERIYVHEKIYDHFTEAFVKEVKSYQMGLPAEDGVYIGPLTRPSQIDFIQSQVNEAVADGAVLAAGGKRADRRGYYYEPTVLLNTNNRMRVMREESFGPVIGIAKVKDDDEALQQMNDTDYGLTAAVYSSSEERALKLLSKTNSGTGYWNCCDRVSAAVPWSGRKHSGFGATLSHMGMRAFTQPKALHLRG